MPWDAEIFGRFEYSVQTDAVLEYGFQRVQFYWNVKEAKVVNPFDNEVNALEHKDGNSGICDGALDAPRCGETKYYTMFDVDLTFPCDGDIGLVFRCNGGITVGPFC